MHGWQVGEVIHGFAGGSFGRDSYTCRRVEAAGLDWVVCRNADGVVETASGGRVPTIEEGQDRSWCTPYCRLEVT